MVRRLGVLIGVTVALAACGGGAPTSQGPQASAPAGATGQPEQGPAASAGTPAATAGAPSPAAAGPEGGGPITQVAQPGSADMGAVTPGATSQQGAPVEQPRPGSPGPQGQIDRATADLAGRTGVSATSIAVQRVEIVDWPDGSLGCPAPGMAYTEAIVPGYRIMLQAGGQTYTYHTDSATTVVLCADGRPAA